MMEEYMNVLQERKEKITALREKTDSYVKENMLLITTDKILLAEINNLLVFEGLILKRINELINGIKRYGDQYFKIHETEKLAYMILELSLRRAEEQYQTIVNSTPSNIGIAEKG